MSSLDDLLNSLPSMEDGVGILLSRKSTQNRAKKNQELTLVEKVELLEKAKRPSEPYPPRWHQYILIDREGVEVSKGTVNGSGAKGILILPGVNLVSSYTQLREEITSPALEYRVFEYNGELTHLTLEHTGRYVYVERKKE